MSTKGSIIVGDGAGNPQTLSVGTNGYALVADSSTATGLTWSSVSGGGISFDGSTANGLLTYKDTEPTVESNLTFDGSTLSVTGNIVCDTSLTVDSTVISSSELSTIDGITPGTAAASKALILDANKDIGTIRNLTIDGVFTDGNYTFDTSGNVTGLGTISSGNITTSDTLTINGSSGGTLKIRDNNNTHYYSIVPGNLGTNSTINLPNLTSGTTRLVGHDTTDTLTNKTIDNLILTGTLTANSGTGTSGQVLKSTGTGIEWADESGGGGISFSGSTANGLVSYSNSTTANVSSFCVIDSVAMNFGGGYIADSSSGGDNGGLTLYNYGRISFRNQEPIRFYQGNLEVDMVDQYIVLKGPDTLSGSGHTSAGTLTLPEDTGTIATTKYIGNTCCI